MDINEYISSGIIEMHVLGMASDKQSEELLRLCQLHPQIREELEKTEESLLRLNEAGAVAPPSGLKEQIAATLFSQNTTTTDTVSTPSGETIPLPSAAKTNTINWKWVAAASIVFCILSVLGNVYLYQKKDSYEQQLSRIEESNKRLAEERKTYFTNLQQAEETLADATAPGTRQIILEGVPSHERAQAVVLWNEHNSSVYLSLTQLPPAPAGKQYQLWAIVDGKPVDAGVYQPGGSVDLQKMKAIAKAEMFAITLEKEGGSPEPTLTEMYVAGKT